MNVFKSEGNVASWRRRRRGAHPLVCGQFAGACRARSTPQPALARPIRWRRFRPSRGAVPAAPAGIDPQLFARAKAALDQHRISARDTIGIADFSKPSSEARFHVVDLAERQRREPPASATAAVRTRRTRAISSGSATISASYATSNGTYVTDDYYHGKYGLSLRVRGLDWTNNNAEPRAIVIHNAWYAEPEMIPQHGMLGRSEGCFAMPKESQYEVMRKLAGGRMIYADKLA